MSEGDRAGDGQMNEHPRGAGFAPGQGVWQPVPTGGDFDFETTGHMPLPGSQPQPQPEPGAPNPLAAPGRGLPTPPAGDEAPLPSWAPGAEAPPQAAYPATADPRTAPPSAQSPYGGLSQSFQQPPALPEAPDFSGYQDPRVPFAADPSEPPAYAVPAPVPAPEPPAELERPGPEAQEPPADAEPGEAAGRPPETEAEADPEPETEPETDPHSEHPLASYVLRVNGTDRPVTDAWIGESLLYVLRERLGLAGAKDGCEQGECGACSVQVDGRLVASCLVPAATSAGCDVRTVEGLPSDGEPSDVQRALAASGAVQCGYCVPGLAMAVHDLLSGNHRPTDLQIREALCGNLCRCTGYRGVLSAVREVAAAREAAANAAQDGEAVQIPRQAGPDGSSGLNGGGT